MGCDRSTPNVAQQLHGCIVMPRDACALAPARASSLLWAIGGTGCRLRFSTPFVGADSAAPGTPGGTLQCTCPGNVPLAPSHEREQNVSQSFSPFR
jgi:hypothetical protein